jgi:hypothetical protein
MEKVSRRAVLGMAGAGIMAGVSVPNQLQAAGESPVAAAGAARLAADEFPHQRDGIYLNHAASAPMPLRTSCAPTPTIASACSRSIRPARRTTTSPSCSAS